MRNKSVNKVFSKYNIDMILRMRAAFVIIFLGCEISAQDADWCEDIDWSHNEFDSSKINIFLYTRFVQLSTPLYPLVRTHADKMFFSKNPHFHQTIELTEESLLESHFNPEDPTIIVAHGWNR